MTFLSPTLLKRLGRSKLGARKAIAASGVGERPSRAKGLGIEFAEHRPYQPGDDIRHLDQHLYARLGEYHIRQFSRYQQLKVSILLDVSRSMHFGEPEKLSYAKSLVAGLAYLALAGGDNVQLAAFSNKELNWSSQFHGIRRAPEVFHWLKALKAENGSQFKAMARRVVGQLQPESLLIIISDFLTTDLEDALRIMSRKQQDLIAIQVLAPEEEDPTLLGEGELRLIDNESGQEQDISLNSSLIKGYQEYLEAFFQSLQETMARHQGRYLRVTSGTALEQIFLADWRKAGLVQ